jgi:hypothetical protein
VGSSFQYALSLRLAREHPEITERLAEEMMQRNLQERQLTARQQFLMCMRPWFDNLSFVKLRESDVSARLLQSLYYITLRNNDAYPAVMETLWSAIASKVRPVVGQRGEWRVEVEAERPPALQTTLDATTDVVPVENRTVLCYPVL